MTHWGRAIDKMVADDSFVSLMNEEHEAATRQKSRMLAILSYFKKRQARNFICASLLVIHRLNLIMRL